MVEESKTEQEGKGILAQVREERELLAKEREETQKLFNQLKELRAEDILSGRAPGPTTQVKPVISDVEYAKAAREGRILK